VEKHARNGESERSFGLGIRFEMATERCGPAAPRNPSPSFADPQGSARFVPAHVRLGEALAEEGQKRSRRRLVRRIRGHGIGVFLTMLEEHFLERERPEAAIDASSLRRRVAKGHPSPLPPREALFPAGDARRCLAVLSSLEGRASYSPALHYLVGRVHERRKNFRDSPPSTGRSSARWTSSSWNTGARLRRDQHGLGRALRLVREWNAVDVNFREEISADELGLSAAPVYTANPDND